MEFYFRPQEECGVTIFAPSCLISPPFLSISTQKSTPRGRGGSRCTSRSPLIIYVPGSIERKHSNLKCVGVTFPVAAVSKQPQTLCASMWTPVIPVLDFTYHQMVSFDHRKFKYIPSYQMHMISKYYHQM